MDMNANTQTNAFKNFIVYNDGVLDESLSVIAREPSLIDKAKANISLQWELAVYDTLHRTSYRRTYNRLIREKRNHELEQRLGLVRVK